MAFNIPAQTSFSVQRPVTLPTAWTRQPDWISITDTAGEIQFLVSDIENPAVYRIETVYTKPASQNIYIDWGDGVVDTISTATATSTEHTYTGGGTACAQGYNTWKIRIYADAGATITQATNLIPTLFGSVQNISGILEEYYGDGTITTALYLHNFSTTRPLFYNLQYSKLPAVMTSASLNFGESYTNCFGLAKVVLPTSAPNCQGMGSMFSNCYALQSATLPQDMSGSSMTNITSAFQNCFSLTGITLPPALPGIASLQSTFNSCNSLTTIKLPSELPLVTNFVSAFSNCRSLLTIEIPPFYSGSSGFYDFNSTFTSCVSLEYVKMPTYVNPTPLFYANSMFQSCTSLKSFVFPPNANLENLNTTFTSCSSLASITLPTTTSISTFANAFSNCNDLQEITLPNTIGAAAVPMNSAFNNCQSLSKIVIPSSYNIGTMATTFNGCSNLNTVTLPNNSQNNISTFASTFSSCSNLRNVVLPTSLTGLTTTASMFNNCFNLTGVTFPSSMNSVTTVTGWFTGCNNLETVTLPTSMSSLTTTSTMFSNCYKLRTVTLPATVGAMTTFASTFNNCYSLKTIVLPTTQTTSLVAAGLSSMFSNCYSVSAITNSDKIGNTSTSSTVYLDGTAFGTTTFESLSLDLYPKFSKFTVNGISTRLNKLNSLRLRNNGSGQYAGTSPQIDISYTSLGQAAIVQVFNDLPTVTSKTINITGASGAAALTAPERAIATGKGWTITG